MITVFIITLLFWTLVYFLEGKHDASLIIIQVDLTKGWKDREAYKKHSKIWHVYDSYVFAIFHLLFAGGTFFYFYSVLTYTLIQMIVLTAALLLVALAVRMIIHDAVIYKYWKGIFNHIPSCEGKYDWFDCFINKMNEKGINQYVFKFAVLAVTIVLYFLSMPISNLINNIIGLF